MHPFSGQPIETLVYNTAIWHSGIKDRLINKDMAPSSITFTVR